MSLENGLVEFWNLDDLAGFARVGSFAGRDLTETGAVARVSPFKVVDGIHFTEGTYVFSNDSAFNITGNQSMSYWIRVNVGITLDFPGLMGKWGAGNQRSYSTLFLRTLNQFRYSVSDDGVNSFSLTYSLTASIGVIYNVQCYADLDNDEQGMRVDTEESLGSWETQELTISSIFDGTASFDLGHLGTSDNTINGDMDAAGIWSRRLADNEFDSLWNNGAGRQHPFPSAALNSISPPSFLAA